MTSEEIFNAGQYILLKMIEDISNIHNNLKDVDTVLARQNLEFLVNNLNQLENIIDYLEKSEYEELENVDLESESSES